MALNIWKDIYMRSVRKKVQFKNTLYFRKYKKDKFLTKRYTILLFTYFNTIYNQKFVFFISSKIQRVFNETFLHTLLLYIYIYIYLCI
jgi:hypothetical protein